MVVEKGRSLSAGTAAPSAPTTLARMARSAEHRWVAEEVAREVSPSTVLHRERREREVMVEESPRASMAAEELQKPLTTAWKASSRWYLARASSRRGPSTFRWGSWATSSTPSLEPLHTSSHEINSCSALTSDLVLRILPVLTTLMAKERRAPGFGFL